MPITFPADDEAHALRREAQRHEVVAARFRDLGEHTRAIEAMRRAQDCRRRAADAANSLVDR